MESNWASENLQVIRTLMERATVYRRALAPMMLAVGSIGTGSAVFGVGRKLDYPTTFLMFWMGVAACALAVAFLLARRQALKADESFWTPPARRVAQGMIVPLIAGVLLTVGPMRFWHGNSLFVTWLLPIWMLCYACALHAGGTYMPRGIRLLAWIFVAIAAGFLGYLGVTKTQEISIQTAHLMMGATFGLLQLAYGVYLHFTEKQSDAA